MRVVKRIIEADNCGHVILLEIIDDLLVPLRAHIHLWVHVGEGEELVRQNPGNVHSMKGKVKLVDVEIVEVYELLDVNGLVEGFKVKVQSDWDLGTGSCGVLEWT